MQLNVGTNISFRVFDEYYNMALLSCRDEMQRYWFSLTRSVGSKRIEVMVLDQINHHTAGHDISVHLERARLVVELSSELARNLDGNTTYEVEFDLNDIEVDQMKLSLEKIFEGTAALHSAF